jgi:hypothetical protein
MLKPELHARPSLTKGLSSSMHSHVDTNTLIYLPIFVN